MSNPSRQLSTSPSTSSTPVMMPAPARHRLNMLLSSKTPQQMWLIKHRQMPPAKAMEECVSPRHSISMAG